VRVLFYYRGIENLGVGYLMSMLKAHGHEISLIFDPGLDDNLFLKAPHLAWLNRHEELLARAVAFKPDLIAMGSLTNLWPFCSKMAEKLKEKIGVPILVGGHHAQALPGYILENPNVDMACTGEGEIALLELVTRMERGEDITTIPTLWVKQNGVVHRNEMGELENDLDKFPFPEKQLWWEYGCFRTTSRSSRAAAAVQVHVLQHPLPARDLQGKGDFLRKRTIGNVMEEFKQNLAKYDPKFVSVHDDNFTTDPHWVEEFCEAYRKEVNLPWYCFGYPTTLKPKLLKAMKSANCATIFMGVDSGSPEIRRNLMERPMTDELIYKSAQAVKDAGIGLQISCIYGNPGETPEQMFKTLTMVDKIRPTQCSAYIFYPFPRTKLHDRAVKMGYLDEEGQEKVRRGISGYHHESILKHAEGLAETLAKVTPVYARSPEMFKPILRWVIAHRMKRLALFLYVCLIPLTFPFLGVEGIKVTLRMAWKALRGHRPVMLPARAPPVPESDAA
jgi:radical SAM superfamily enzyme YgiQ (UPF0313 family)